MSNVEKVAEIAAAIAQLKMDLDHLESIGKEIPAVAKNAVRMKGALRQLEVQFSYLSEVCS